ncbi:hypothetical protein [Halorientalis halophila]|uniref:hypothetical protein n=1 Tax=Halorientalis halophila TaxID=3108499 RepID=UPI00300BD1FF
MTTEPSRRTVELVRVGVAGTTVATLVAVSLTAFGVALPGAVAGVAVGTGVALVLPALLAPERYAADSSGSVFGFRPLPAGFALAGSGPLVFVGLFVSGSLALAVSMGLLGAIAGYRLFAAAIPEDLSTATE